MVDASFPAGGSEPSICPWCSATYTGDPEACPSCGAALAADPTLDAAVPGLTAIDAAAIVRSKTPTQRQRNRLLSWISGEYPEAAIAPGDVAALAPPDDAVRREMLRLELEAEVANLQAEAEAMRAEAVVEGRVLDAPVAVDASAAAEPPVGESAPVEVQPAVEPVDGSTATADGDEVRPA